MCELPMCSTAIGTNESPEICADILWSQVVAVDAALVGGQLEQAPYDPLVPLVLLDPAPHRRRIAPRLQTLRTAAPSLLSSSVRAASEREIPRARARGRDEVVAVAAASKRLASFAAAGVASLRVLLPGGGKKTFPSWPRGRRKGRR